MVFFHCFELFLGIDTTLRGHDSRFGTTYSETHICHAIHQAPLFWGIFMIYVFSGVGGRWGERQTAGRPERAGEDGSNSGGPCVVLRSELRGPILQAMGQAKHADCVLRVAVGGAAGRVRTPESSCRTKRTDSGLKIGRQCSPEQVCVRSGIHAVRFPPIFL